MIAKRLGIPLSMEQIEVQPFLSADITGDLSKGKDAIYAALEAGGSDTFASLIKEKAEQRLRLRYLASLTIDRQHGSPAALAPGGGGGGGEKQGEASAAPVVRARVYPEWVDESHDAYFLRASAQQQREMPPLTRATSCSWQRYAAVDVVAQPFRDPAAAHKRNSRVSTPPLLFAAAATSLLSSLCCA